MINIYMVAVKGIYQVFTLGIRFGGWIIFCSRADRRIGNSVGGTWRDFIRGGRWWWHKTLKLSLFLGISLSLFCLLSSCLLPHTDTHLGDILQMWMDIFALRCRPGGDARKMLHFQRCHKSAGHERLDYWPSLSLPSVQVSHVHVTTFPYCSLL